MINDQKDSTSRYLTDWQKERFLKFIHRMFSREWIWNNGKQEDIQKRYMVSTVGTGLRISMPSIPSPEHFNLLKYNQSINHIEQKYNYFKPYKNLKKKKCKVF